jgi:heme A synthase
MSAPATNADPAAPRERFTMTPGRYRAVTVFALVMLALIVVTGAAVRLTESGLGPTAPRVS